MTTLFDILNTLNNNKNNSNNNYTGCKKQYSINKRVDIIPSMDVTLTNDKLIIETELTGVSKNDIDINIKDSILIIQGEKKKTIIKQQQQQQQQQQQHQQHQQLQQQLENSNNKQNDEPSIEEFEEDVKSKSELNKDEDKTTSNINKKFISERSFGNFKRYLNLSELLYQLDLNSIDTQFENGLLTITIKKKSDFSNTIKININ
ncbi:hypothetical protein ACTFIZ_010192 [Dictyostelium cf. discoideum]